MIHEIALPKLTPDFQRIMKQISSKIDPNDIRSILSNKLPNESWKNELEKSSVFILFIQARGEYNWKEIIEAKKSDKSDKYHSEEYWMRKLFFSSNSYSKELNPQKSIPEPMKLNYMIHKPEDILNKDDQKIIELKNSKEADELRKLNKI